MKSFEYFTPRSLEEAIGLLDKYGKKAKVLAGGTDLIVQMKAGIVCPSYIIDLKYVSELNRLEADRSDNLHIGAAVPLSKIVASELVKEKFTLLHQACSLIGSDQIRNRATLGGNICNAAPSADSAPPLLCLEAKAIVYDSKGSHPIALENFFLGPGKTTLQSGQVLVEIQVPPLLGRFSGCYLRLTTREEMDIALVGVASLLTVTEKSDICRNIKIALGAVSPTPIMVTEVEATLKGKQITTKAIELAAEMAAGCCVPISDMRASAEYRREMVKVLTRRTLISAGAALDVKV